MTGGDATLEEMIAATERGLLLTTLWYIPRSTPPPRYHRADPRRRVSDRGRHGERRGQQLPVQRIAAGSVAPHHTGQGQRDHPAARMVGLGHRDTDAAAGIPDFNMSSVSQAQ